MNQNTKKRIAKVLSVTTSITTTLWMSGAAMLAPMTTKAAVTINEGDIFRASNDYKVYIAKYVGGKSFKRWFVGPQMFDFYKHLGFAKVKVVDPSVAAAFTESKLVRAAGDDKVYYIGDATAGVGASKKWVPTLAAFQAAGFDWDGVYVINSAEAGWYTMGANFDGSTVTPSTTPTAGAISASLATDNPAGAVLASGSLYNSVLKVTLWAPATGGATITSLTVTKFGLVANSNISGISVWDANNMRHGSVASSLSADNSVTIGFGSNPITVPAGGSATITVKASLGTGATSGTVYFGINGASGIQSNSTVGGAFPLVGNLFTLANGASALGDIRFSAQAEGGLAANSGSGNVDVGALQKEVAKFQLTQNNNNEDVQLESITLYAEGDINDSQLKNWTLYDVAGNVLGSAANTVDRYATINLATPYVVPKGQTKTVYVKVDFVDGANRGVRVHVQNDYDVLVRGVSTRSFLLPAGVSGGTFADAYDSSTGWFKMRQGTLSVTKASDSPSTQLSVGQTDALLAKFTLRAQGEDMELRKMDLAVLRGSHLQELTGNISVRSGDGAVTYLSISGASSSGIYDDSATRFDLSTYIQLKSNVDTVIAVYGNVSTNATASDSYQAEVRNFYAKRLSSIDYVDNIPSASTYTQANQLNVVTTSATIAANTAMGGVTVPPGLANAKIGSFVAQGGQAEDAKVSNVSLKFATNLNDASASNISNLKLMVNGVQQGTAVAVPTQSGNTFSTSIALPKATTVVVDVFADLKSTATTIQAIVTQDGVTVIGNSTGNSITKPGSDVTLQLVSAAAGNLQITKDSSSPTDQVVTPANGVLLGNWKFAANNEDLKLSKVTFTAQTGSNANVTATTGAQNFGTLYLKDGSTTLASGQLVLNGSAYDVTFTNLGGSNITIPASGSKILSLYADLTASGIQNPNTIVYFVVKNDTTPTNIDVTGSAGELATANINTSGADSNIAASNKFLYENSKPVIAAASNTPAGTGKIGTAGDTLFIFTVTNSGTRDMRVGSLSVTVSESGMAGGSISTFDLYDGTTKVASTAVANAVTCNSVTPSVLVRFDANNDYSSYFADLQISAGASKTFTLKADTSSIRSTVASGNTVSLTTKIDGTTGSIDGSTWNPGNFAYYYTPTYGTEQGPFYYSDSYAVQGGTLQY